ncbi:hypothetical protein SCP_0700060 [Sparassis crispa]|uniref:Uncharacterized protein n=1 Tax=Sparassis crispa TaxID=139825 RepID=A0A401GRJ0_9APHY|nr:hypothetical protein SCP_0700060 [Sparassis crispa]GBE84826.1 hypothetical protein SCP_0700060 [Sparassis crispa]
MWHDGPRPSPELVWKPPRVSSLGEWIEAETKPKSTFASTVCGTPSFVTDSGWFSAALADDEPEVAENERVDTGDFNGLTLQDFLGLQRRSSIHGHATESSDRLTSAGSDVSRPGNATLNGTLLQDTMGRFPTSTSSMLRSPSHSSLDIEFIDWDRATSTVSLPGNATLDGTLFRGAMGRFPTSTSSMIRSPCHSSLDIDFIDWDRVTSAGSSVSRPAS